jgi:hypothetical protein
MRIASSERFRRETAKIIQEQYERHEKIYTDGFKKDERVGYAVITPNRTYRRRVHQQSTIFSTKQEAIVKAIWLTEGTQRDKEIITKHTDGDQREQLHQNSENNKTKEDDGPK